MERVCWADGCNEVLGYKSCKGLCPKHYHRYRVHGDPNFLKIDGITKKNSREYHTWYGVKQRCYNPNEKAYPNYGGRGIKVCDEWRNRHGFRQFLKDMGKCPKGYTLDRIDVNGNYEPANCRWAGWHTQASNKRKPPKRTSSYVGVSKLGYKWKAEIIVKGDRHYTIHQTEEEAVKARKKMERDYLGREL